MAPPGRQRSRRRPGAFNKGLVLSRSQQSCEAAARQVAVARLTRPAERSFKNQQESLRATRKEAAALVPFSRRLEQDLLSLVCDKKRDDQASGRRRYSSPVRSRRLKERRHSCECRDSEDQQERRRRRKGSPQRRRADPSSPSPSSSCSSDWSYGKRRRKSRWRSRRSYSPEERVPALRAPPSAAPSARASFRRSTRHFTTPPSARTGDVTRSASSSPGRRQSKTEKDEKRDHIILVHSLQHVHNALDAKRLQLYPDKSVLADLRSYCQDVAPKTQSEESLSEDAASPSPMQKQPPAEQKALVVDPEFIVDSSPAEEEEEDEVLLLDASLEARSASPASSLLPDSPRKEHELFFKEAEKRQEGEERLDRRGERREEVEQAATVDSALWQRGGLPGTTASAFLVPWNRPAVRQTGPRLAAPPVSYAPAVAAAPPVSYAPAAAASSSSSFQSGAFRKPDVVTFKDWRKAARLPPPVARPVEDTISWCGDLYPTGTSMTPPPRPLVPSWSAPRSSTLPPLFSTPALPRPLPAPRVPPTRPAGPPPSQPAGPPPSQPAGPPPSQQPAEEFITEFYPAVWRRPRRCFSPTPDHPLLFCRPYGQQQPHVPAPRPYVPAPRPFVPPLPPCLAPSLCYPAPRLCLPPPRPRHAMNRENQPATQSRMQRPWRPPGRGTF